MTDRNGEGRKLALVTGASHGIGRATAVALCRRGYDVVATARSEAELRETADRIRREDASHRVDVVTADISTSAGRDAVVDATASKRHGRLDVLIHAASASTDPDAHKDLVSTPEDVIEQIARTTFEGTCLLLRRFVPLLAQAERANIILIASDWGLRGSHGPPVFSAAKAAVAHLAHTMRRALATSGTHITTLWPGDVATFDTEWVAPKWDLDDPLDDVIREHGASRIALIDLVETIEYVLRRRLAKVEEIILSPPSGDYDY